MKYKQIILSMLLSAAFCQNLSAMDDIQGTKKADREQQIHAALSMMPVALIAIVKNYARELTLGDIHHQIPGRPVGPRTVAVHAKEVMYYINGLRRITQFKREKLTMPGTQHKFYGNPDDFFNPMRHESLSYSCDFSIGLEPSDTFESIQEKIAKCGLSPERQALLDSENLLSLKKIEHFRTILYEGKIRVNRKRKAE